MFKSQGQPSVSVVQHRWIQQVDHLVLSLLEKKKTTTVCQSTHAIQIHVVQGSTYVVVQPNS